MLARKNFSNRTLASKINAPQPGLSNPSLTLAGENKFCQPGKTFQAKPWLAEEMRASKAQATPFRPFHCKAIPSASRLFDESLLHYQNRSDEEKRAASGWGGFALWQIFPRSQIQFIPLMMRETDVHGFCGFFEMLGVHGSDDDLHICGMAKNPG